MATTRVFLTFPQRLISEPVLYDVTQRFGVRTNIRGASITSEIALVALQIDGEPDAIEETITHLGGLGVQVERLSDSDG